MDCYHQSYFLHHVINLLTFIENNIVLFWFFFQPEPTTPAKPPGKSNDCEIVCVCVRQFAERIEARLKVIGLKVDVLFPNPKVDLQKIIADIASRGVRFAILVTPLNEDHNSVTLNILQGDLQEHRNMPLEDAISMIAHIFEKGLNNTDQSQGNVAKWVMFLHIWVKISASLSYLEQSELLFLCQLIWKIFKSDVFELDQNCTFTFLQISKNFFLTFFSD